MNKITEFWPVAILFSVCCVLAILDGGWFMVLVGLVFSSAMTLQMLKKNAKKIDEGL
jgi:hypothetical protein